VLPGLLYVPVGRGGKSNLQNRSGATSMQGTARGLRTHKVWRALPAELGGIVRTAAPEGGNYSRGEGRVVTNGEVEDYIAAKKKAAEALSSATEALTS
jgi:hypothetical protein